MALQTINIGTFANDGTGDDLRTAFTKVNANFEEIDLVGGQNNTISNVGVGVGIYKEKIGVDLRLKSLVAGPGITLTNNAMDITITNNRNMIVTVNADTGSLTATSATQVLNIVGGTGISTSINNNTLTITGNNYNIETDTDPALGGNLDLNGFDIDGGTGSRITADQFIGDFSGHLTGDVTGNVTGLVYDLDIREVNSAINIFDFGPINGDMISPMQWFLCTSLIDLGSFTSPSPLGIDGGTFV